MLRVPRSRSDRLLGGVLGGIAQHFAWPATRLRIGYLALSVLSAGFPGMLVYAVLWFVMPDEPPRSRPLEMRVET